MQHILIGTGIIFLLITLALAVAATEEAKLKRSICGECGSRGKIRYITSFGVPGGGCCCRCDSCGARWVSRQGGPWEDASSPEYDLVYALRTILVVTPEAYLGRLCEVHLQRAGYKVLLATNGLEAWEMIRTGRPDIVVCDAYPGGLTRWELLQRAKADPALRDIPFINMESPEDIRSLVMRHQGYQG